MGRIVITGANGQLGTCIREVIEKQMVLGNSSYFFCSKEELDITNPKSIEETLKKYNPSVVVNCAAYTNVDKAEDEPSAASKLNVSGVKILGEYCEKNNIFLIHISTDYVFSGKESTPYKNEAKAKPLNVYGKTKSAGESLLKSTSLMIIRTSWLYSEFGNNFMKTIINKLKQERYFSVVSDQIGTPTYAMDLAKFIVTIIEEDKYHSNAMRDCKVVNYSNEGCASWYDFAKAIEDIATPLMFGQKTNNIIPCRSEDLNQKAKRPKYTVMDKTDTYKQFKVPIPYWRDSLKKCIYKYIEKNKGRL